MVLVFTYSWGLDMKVSGIWLAFGITNGFLLVIYVVQLFRANWKE